MAAQTQWQAAFFYCPCEARQCRSNLIVPPLSLRGARFFAYARNRLRNLGGGKGIALSIFRKMLGK